MFLLDNAKRIEFYGAVNIPPTVGFCIKPYSNDPFSNSLFPSPNTSKESFCILMNTDNGEIVCKISSLNAFNKFYPGAIFKHKKKDYYVDAFDFENHIAYCHSIKAYYNTEPIVTSTLRTKESFCSKSVGADCATINTGIVIQQDTITGYKCIHSYNRQTLSEVELEVPLSRTMYTNGFWLNISKYCIPNNISPQRINEYINSMFFALSSSLANKTQINITQDVALGVIQNREKRLISMVIYDLLFDKKEFSIKAFSMMENIISDAIRSVENCPCKDGCPKCIGFKNVSKSYILQALKEIVGVEPTSEVFKIV